MTSYHVHLSGVRGRLSQIRAHGGAVEEAGSALADAQRLSPDQAGHPLAAAALHQFHQQFGDWLGAAGSSIVALSERGDDAMRTYAEADQTAACEVAWLLD